MYKGSIKLQKSSVAPKPRLHKNTVIRSLSVGQVIAVGIAHTYQKDYGWSDYSECNYIIEKISKKEIIGRSEKFSHEMIKITRQDLDDYRFELRL
jgi:hypothetical protein